MPLINNISFAIPKSITLLLWKCSETTEELLSSLSLTQQEMERLQAIKTENRKKEFLVDRILLQDHFGRQAKLNFAASGKPYIKDETKSISFSHSNDLVMMAIADEAIGIDVQAYSGKIFLVKHKYLAESEHVHYQQLNDAKAYLQVLWSAKEAVFKIYGENLPFKEIVASDFLPNTHGEVLFKVRNANVHKVFYAFFEEYCFCLAI